MSVLVRMPLRCFLFAAPVASFKFAKTWRASPVMLFRSLCTATSVTCAESASVASLLSNSSVLTVSFDGIIAPGCNRGAAFEPVLIIRTSLPIRLTDPTCATDFAFKGVPRLTSSEI